MQTLIAAFVICLSTVYILFLDFVAVSPRSLLKALAIPIVALIFLFYVYSKTAENNKANYFQRLTFLLWASIAVQLIVIATGGIQSPFLILIHLCMIGISFTFSFFIATIFLLSSFALLLIDKSFHQNIFEYLIYDPSTTVLQITALISILPIAYVFSKQYHLKEILLTMLRSQMKTDESILMTLDEMVIITDRDLRILSVNNAAERIMQRSRSNLLTLQIFDVFPLQDASGERVTKETFFSKDNKILSGFKSEYMLILPSFPAKKVMLQIQLIEDPELHIDQLCFIIGDGKRAEPKNIALLAMMDKTRAKYDAMNESIKRKLTDLHLPALRMQMVLLEKLGNDLYAVQNASERLISYGKTPTNILKLCWQLVLSGNDFAKIFGVPLNFIAPPDQANEFFYTISCNFQGLELMIKRLLEISVLVASSEKDRNVKVSITKNNDVFIITITGSCPRVTSGELQEIFQPHYGRLLQETNLIMGSGLEGYLVKNVADLLSYQLDAKIEEEQSLPKLVFTLKVKK